MPPHLRGAIVDCFVAASDHLKALELAVEEASKRGLVFEDLMDGQVQQLDPLKWDEYVVSTWPDLADHFPRQVQILQLVQAGGAFFGPFFGWETETNS
jgi:hypothetical protein